MADTAAGHCSHVQRWRGPRRYERPGGGRAGPPASLTRACVALAASARAIACAPAASVCRAARASERGGGYGWREPAAVGQRQRGPRGLRTTEGGTSTAPGVGRGGRCIGPCDRHRAQSTGAGTGGPWPRMRRRLEGGTMWSGGHLPSTLPRAVLLARPGAPA